MSHLNKEQTFKGKPISQLDAFEWDEYRRACQKHLKKSLKPEPIKNDGSKWGNPKFGS